MKDSVCDLIIAGAESWAAATGWERRPSDQWYRPTIHAPHRRPLAVPAEAERTRLGHGGWSAALPRMVLM